MRNRHKWSSDISHVKSKNMGFTHPKVGYCSVSVNFHPPARPLYVVLRAAVNFLLVFSSNRQPKGEFVHFASWAPNRHQMCLFGDLRRSCIAVTAAEFLRAVFDTVRTVTGFKGRIQTVKPSEGHLLYLCTIYLWKIIMTHFVSCSVQTHIHTCFKEINWN